MLEHGEELNLRMLQPLDTDTTAGILRESGYLVPLSKWSKARQDYKGNTDRWALQDLLGEDSLPLVGGEESPF